MGETETVVALSPADHVLLWAGAPLACAGAGWLLKVAVLWAATLPWVPFEKPLRLLASVPEPHVTVGAVALGAVAGLVLAALAVHDHVRVTVDGERVELAHRDSRTEVRRADVGAVFLDGRRLVILGTDTRQLARTTGDLPAAGAVEAAFTGHGYPWRDGDPYRDRFRRWVDGHPELPADAHAYLRTRERALREKDHADAEEMRAHLTRLGLVVREEGGRQYWRSTA